MSRQPPDEPRRRQRCVVVIAYELVATSTPGAISVKRPIGPVYHQLRPERPAAGLGAMPAVPRRQREQPHRQRLQAVDERARPPAQRLGGHRQPHRAEPRQQVREGDLRLQPGQRRAQAVVDAVAERQVPRSLPAKIQPVRVGVPGRIAVRRAQRDDHRVAAADARPADLDGLGGEPVGRVVDRVHVPEQFLHRAAKQRRVGLQPGELARVEQQREHAAGDQVDRGLMSGHQQQEHHGHQLILPEPVSLVPG